MILLAGGAGSFVLACHIHAVHSHPGMPAAQRGAATAFLGESRMGLAGHCYEVADLYFHRGVPHRDAEGISGTWFQQLLARTSPAAHVHLNGQDVRELLPWLRLATRMDPHNVDTILVAAFWLATDAARPDLAQQMLQNAQVDNPFDYEIQLERARIFLRMDEVPRARDALEAALTFWPGRHDADSRDARHDRARILLYRAMIHEVDGEPRAAIAGLREILTIHPDWRFLLERIETLERGEAPALVAPGVWNNLLQKDSNAHMLCHREHADASRDGHDDHDDAAPGALP